MPNALIRFASLLPLSKDDRAIIRKCITPGSVVFEVGQTPGNWSNAVARFAGRKPRRFEALGGIDAQWPRHNGLISVLRLNNPDGVEKTLAGATDALHRGAIDYLVFSAGPGDSGPPALSIKTRGLLAGSGYHLFATENGCFAEATNPDKGVLLAVNERLLTPFTGAAPRIQVSFDEIKAYGIPLKGVVHVGAHEGEEVPQYQHLGLSPILLFEANPELARGLRSKFADTPEIALVEGAVSDKNGPVTFNIASGDQSSSLLGLKRHADLYPTISYTTKVEVQAYTLDHCFEHQLAHRSDLQNANLLMMDIQGAELMALKGATKLLAQIEAIQIEVNYDELYEGCPLVWDLDEFLEAKGFVRVKTQTPFSPLWGDALYVRRTAVAASLQN